MTKMLLNLRGFVIFYLIEVKIFVTEKWRNFGKMRKSFPDKKSCQTKFCPIRFLFSGNLLWRRQKYVLLSIFYAKALKRFPEKRFRVYRGFSFHWSNYILSKFWKWLKQEREFENHPDRLKFIPPNVL